MPIEMLAVVLITEIMYNPASDEQPPVQTEWVELYNPGNEAIDLGGWYLADEDGQTVAIPAGVTIAPGEAIVLTAAEQSVEDFQAAWGEGFQVVPLAQFGSRPGMSGLANSPSDTNEVLALHRSDASIADAVNYDDQGDWPSDSTGGPSIYLLPGQLDADANDHGANWARSAPGTHGGHAALATDDYDPADLGSPGHVTVTDDAPAAE